MRWLIILGLFAACGDGGGSDPTCASDYPPPASMDAEYTACEVDGDCVVVELGKCDACNGGTAVAVSAVAEADVFDRYAECPPDDENWACTEMACPPLYAVCDGGTCALDQATTW